MSGETKRLRYNRKALRRDYGRAAAGLAMSVLLLALVSPGSWSFLLVLTIALVFLAYAATTGLKHAMIIELAPDSVSLSWAPPLAGIFSAKRLDLADITKLKLRYFGRRRRDRGDGIVELIIGTSSARLTADNSLEGFDDLVTRASDAAERRQLMIDASTSANLSSLGFR